MSRKANRRLTLVLISCSALLGCFEEPVQERVHIHIAGPRAFGVTVVQEVASPDIARGNRAVEDRMEEARDALAGGWDRWSRIFSSQQPDAERTSMESVDQSVRRAVHTAVFNSPRALTNLLAQADLGVDMQFDNGEGWAMFYPQGGSQATSRQYKNMQHQLDAWTETVAVYLQAAIETYRHLELNPSEKIPVFSHLFDSQTEGSGPMSPQAEALVRDLKPAMETVAEQALEIDKGNAWSLNEMSHLVFDGFPPRLTVSIAGDVISAEGFDEINGNWERPSVDLWTALRRLEEQWIQPALVTAIISPGTLDDLPDPDPLEFASAPISTAIPPSASDVAAALIAELEAEQSLSLRWRLGTPNPDDGLSLQGLLNITEKAALSSD